MEKLVSLAKKFKKDKRGVFGLTAIQAFIVSILGIALIGFVTLAIMSNLGSTNIFGSTTNLAYNNSQNILNNVSVGIGNLFGALTPVYAILAVLVIILVLVVVVRVVQNPQGSSAQPSL